jgi:hypothetical protein
MRAIVADLRLDIESIATDRDFCIGIGTAYEAMVSKATSHDEAWPYIFASATNFRRAGAHSLLLDDTGAYKTFERAARLYSRGNGPYALLVSSFAADPQELKSTAESVREEAGGAVFPQADLVYPLLTIAAALERNARHQNERVRGELAAMERTPVGILGVPVGAYLDLADVLQDNDDIEQRLPAALLPILAAYDTALRRASKNRYHWRTLNMPFHPAEPDFLGVLFIIESALRARGTHLSAHIEKLPFFWATREIINDSVERRFRAH